MRAVLIGIPLAVAALAGAGAAVAPNPFPLVVLGLVALFCAQTARECCPRSHRAFYRRLNRKIRRLMWWRRLVGNARNR